MKRFLILTLLSALISLGIPYCAISAQGDFSPPREQNSTDEISYDTISVYFADRGTAQTMDFREYVIGVVAAEMPVDFHEEALSACACAAATLARIRIRKGTDESLDGAVISTDPKTHQAYMTTEQMAEKWEGDFDAYYEKLCAAVDKAIGYIITYEGEMIVPVYHAMSTGRTESAENVWGAPVPYLVSVESTGDILCEKYLTQKTLSFDEFSAALEAEGAVFPEDITLWIGDGVYTPSGTLTEIEIGGITLSGARLREIFSLRSNAVVLSITKDGVTLTVRGYGHGVGMSQYGADYLADNGLTWQEILCHYYTGAEIVPV